MMRRYLLITLFTVLSTTIVAQNRFGLSVNLGTFIAKSPVSTQTNLGFDLSAGLLFSVYKERFYLKPTPNIRMIGFDTGLTTPSRESYLLLGMGLEVLTRFGDFEKIQIFPFGKIAYSAVAMTLTNGLQGPDAENQNICLGGAPSFGFGIIGEMKSFQLKLQYEILRPDLKYADDVTQTQKDSYSNHFKFDNLSLTLGYTFSRR